MKLFCIMYIEAREMLCPPPPGLYPVGTNDDVIKSFFTYLLTYSLTHSLTHSLAHSFTHSLTPWSRVLLEKLTGFQLDKKFPAFYWTRRFITAFTSARHLFSLLIGVNDVDGVTGEETHFRILVRAVRQCGVICLVRKSVLIRWTSLIPTVQRYETAPFLCMTL